MFTTQDEVSAHGMGVALPCGMCQLLDVQLHREREEHAQTICHLGHDSEAMQRIIRKQERRINHLMLGLFALGCIVAYLGVRG